MASTTITPTLLVTPAQLGSADAVVYTVPTQTTVQIQRAVFTNTSASAVTITAGFSTGALAANNTVISAQTLAPGQAYVAPELAGAVLPAGYGLHAFASVASAVTLTVSGLTIV